MLSANWGTVPLHVPGPAQPQPAHLRALFGDVRQPHGATARRLARHNLPEEDAETEDVDGRRACIRRAWAAGGREVVEKARAARRASAGWWPWGQARSDPRQRLPPAHTRTSLAHHHLWRHPVEGADSAGQAEVRAVLQA